MQHEKEKLRHAEILVKQYGAEIAGSKKQKGKEFLFITYKAGEDMSALKNALANDGWYMWPETEDTAGCAIECSLYPSPMQETDDPHAFQYINKRIVPQYTPNAVFRYTGCDSNFFSKKYRILFLWVLFCIMGYDILSNGNLSGLTDADIAGRLEGILFIVLLIPFSSSLMHFLSVHISPKGIHIKQNPFEKRTLYVWSSIKNVTPMLQKVGTSGKKGFIRIVTQNNACIDIYLPVNQHSRFLGCYYRYANNT